MSAHLPVRQRRRQPAPLRRRPATPNWPQPRRSLQSFHPARLGPRLFGGDAGAVGRAQVGGLRGRDGGVAGVRTHISHPHFRPVARTVLDRGPRGSSVRPIQHPDPADIYRVCLCPHPPGPRSVDCFQPCIRVRQPLVSVARTLGPIWLGLESVRDDAHGVDTLSHSGHSRASNPRVAGRVDVGQRDRAPNRGRAIAIRRTCFRPVPKAPGDFVLPPRHSRVAGVACRMTAKSAERAARLLVIGLVAGLALAVLMGRWVVETRHGASLLHARIAEAGGWTPGDLSATVGIPLHLRLTSDDVMHGFAVGQTDWPAVDVLPGKATDVTLTFDRPGTYTFFCTRWCGLNHWRMRGTIEVRGPAAELATTTPPSYVTLELDIDAPHLAAVIPARKPSAARGANLGVTIPAAYLTQDYYRAHSPAKIWQALRVETRHGASLLTDDDVWDLVAFVWQSNTS